MGVCFWVFITQPRKIGLWLCYYITHGQATLCFVTVDPVGQSLLLLLGLSAWVAGCAYRKRHILSGSDLNQAILYVAAVASQHFMEMWHYWSWVLICHSTVSFLWPRLYSACHTAAIHSLCLSRWVELACSRNYFHAGRLSRTSLLMILSWLSTWCLGQSESSF